MNCCILGAGAWGTAMALHLDRCGHAVTLVPRRMEAALTSPLAEKIQIIYRAFHCHIAFKLDMNSRRF